MNSGINGNGQFPSSPKLGSHIALSFFSENSIMNYQIRIYHAKKKDEVKCSINNLTIIYTIIYLY